MTRTLALTTPHVRQPMYPCRYCQSRVEQDEITAGRHLAYVCPKVPPDVRALALAIPGVVVEQPSAQQVAAQGERKRERRAASRQRADAKRRQRGRG